MHISDWVIIGLFILGTLANIMLIGKPRTPTSHGQAATVLFINASLIIWTLFSHGVVN